jgi:hypothetical protein
LKKTKSKKSAAQSNWQWPPKPDGISQKDWDAMVAEVNTQIDREEAIIWPQIMQHFREAERREQEQRKKKRSISASRKK